MMKKQKQKGFSLIELLIVVAIILIIAAIAIPNLIKSKMAANESSAVGALRTINTALITYASECPGIGYSATLKEMNTGAICGGGAAIIDNVIGQDPAVKAGYSITYIAGAAVNGVVNSYTLSATPVNIGASGQRGFFTDQTAVVRYNQSGTATVTDPAIQ